MKRLLTIIVVTVLLGLVAYAFIWADNEKAGQEISEFFPRSMNPKTKVMQSGDAMTGDLMTGAMMSGDAMTGAAATGETVVTSGAN